MILINFFFISFALGDISVQNRHSVDNVSERDFLRTEGDPGASGYTIKEAVALTRSVVSLCSDCMIFEWYSVWFSCIINFADVWAKQCKIFMLSWYIINYSQKWFPNEILIITTDIFFRFQDNEPLLCIWSSQFLIRRYIILIRSQLDLLWEMLTNLTDLLTGRLSGLLHLAQNLSLFYHWGEYHLNAYIADFHCFISVCYYTMPLGSLHL